VSYPYPQDRHRDRKEKGEQPYKDAREEMGQAEAELARRAREGGPGPELPQADHEAELEERLREVNREIEQERRPG
jgi:hypothetical protein